MAGKKKLIDQRTRDVGVEGRKNAFIKDIIYIITTVLVSLGVGGGTGYFVNDTLTADTVKQVNSNTQNIELLKQDYETHIENTKVIEKLKAQNVQIQIDNIQKEVSAIKQGQTEIKRMLMEALKEK